MNNKINIYRLLRIARDKTVKELAEELLVTPAYINAIEKGNKIPSPRLIRDYARIFEIDEDVIKNFSNTNKANTKFENALLYLLKKICDDTK